MSPKNAFLTRGEQTSQLALLSDWLQIWKMHSSSYLPYTNFDCTYGGFLGRLWERLELSGMEEWSRLVWLVTTFKVGFKVSNSKVNFLALKSKFLVHIHVCPYTHLFWFDQFVFLCNMWVYVCVCMPLYCNSFQGHGENTVRENFCRFVKSAEKQQHGVYY